MTHALLCFAVVTAFALIAAFVIFGCLLAMTDDKIL